MALALGARVLALGQEPPLGWPQLWAGLCPRAWEPLLLLGEEGRCNTCTPYFGELLLGFLLGGSLGCACPPSFPYGSCHLLTGMTAALNL